MKRLAVIILLIVGVPILLSFIYSTSSITQIVSIVQENKTTFLISLLVGKSVAVIYPPLPGGLLTLGSIPLVGWKWAYTIDIIGSSFGATIAYFLGRKYGVRLLNWLMGEKMTKKITDVNVKQKSQFEAAFMLRTASGGVLSDGLAWGGSLIGLDYLPFILGYIVSHLLTTLPIFYLLSLSIELRSWVIVVPAALVAWFLIYKLKGRYFE